MDNGNNAALRNPVDGTRTWTILVSKDFDSLHVEVGGNMPNCDEGISMLLQAVRALELEKKKQDAIELQAILGENARVRAITDAVRGKRTA